MSQATVLQEINGLYVALYGRAADNPGLSYWIGALTGHDPAVTSANASTLAISAADATWLGQQFVNTQSTYFNAQYGSLGDLAFVQALYTNIGGNTGDANGIQYWVNLLQVAVASGQTAQNARAGIVGQFAHDMLSIDLTVGAAALGLSASDYAAAEARQQQFQNKELVSQNYAVESSLPGVGGAANVLLAPTTTSAGFTAAINAVGGVTSDAATATNAETAIAASVAAGSLNAIMALPGPTFAVDATAINAANATSSPVVVQTPAGGNAIINVQSTAVLKATAGIEAFGNANTTINYAFNGGGAGETLFLSGSGNNVINFTGTTSVPVNGDNVVGGSGTTTINATNVTMAAGESWNGGAGTNNILNVYGTDNFTLGTITNLKTVTMHSTATFTTTEVAGFTSITEAAGGVGSLTILGDGTTNAVNLNGELSGITTLIINGNGHEANVTLGANDLIGITSVTETGGGLITTTVAGALELLAINPSLHYTLSDTAANIAAASAAVLNNSTNYEPPPPPPPPTVMTLTVPGETIALNGTTGTITLSGADLASYPAGYYGTVALAAASGITTVTGATTTTLDASGNPGATSYNFASGVVGGTDAVDSILTYTGITTYKASTHNDTITDSTGGHTIVFATTGSNTVNISGAAGTETITNGTNSGTTTLNVSASSGTVTDTIGAAAATTNAALTGAANLTIVDGGSGTTTVTVGASGGTLSFTGTAAGNSAITFARALTASDVDINIQAPTAALTLNAAQGAAAFTLANANFANIDTISLGATGAYNLVIGATVADTVGGLTINNTTGVAVGVVTVNDVANVTTAFTLNTTVGGSAPGGSTITGSGVAGKVDTITLGNGGSNTVTVLTSTEGDKINMGNGGTNILNATQGGAAAAGLVYNGGTGTGDTLNLTLSGNAAYTAGMITGFEAVTVTNPAGADTFSWTTAVGNIANAAIIGLGTYVAKTATFDASAAAADAKNLTVSVTTDGAALTTLKGENSINQFTVNYTATSTDGHANYVAGSGSSDQLTLNLGAGHTLTQSTTGKITGWETVNINGTAASAAVLTFAAADLSAHGYTANINTGTGSNTWDDHLNTATGGNIVNITDGGGAETVYLGNNATGSTINYTLGANGALTTTDVLHFAGGTANTVNIFTGGFTNTALDVSGTANDFANTAKITISGVDNGGYSFKFSNADQGALTTFDASGLTTGTGTVGVAVNMGDTAAGAETVKGSAVGGDTITTTTAGAVNTAVILGASHSTSDAVNIPGVGTVTVSNEIATDVITISASNTVDLTALHIGTAVNISGGTVSLLNSAGDTLGISGGTTTLNGAGGDQLTFTTAGTVALGTHTSADILIFGTATSTAGATNFDYAKDILEVSAIGTGISGLTPGALTWASGSADSISASVGHVVFVTDATNGGATTYYTNTANYATGNGHIDTGAVAGNFLLVVNNGAAAVEDVYYVVGNGTNGATSAVLIGTLDVATANFASMHLFVPA